MEVVGGYELEARIGEGMSGTVWRARRLGLLSRTVALKRASARAGPIGAVPRDRLLTEAMVLAELDHPHIVDVLDVLDDGEGVAIVMQLAQGGSLRAMLDGCCTLSAGQVAAVAAPVADALASAHRRGLVHGDVKPANILFTSDGEPLLSDFGAARHFGVPVTSAEPVAGTAPYVDPELLNGATASPASDLYALGVVCYEALLGTPPYDGSAEEISRAADRGVHHSLRDVPSVPDRLAELVERAICRDPLDRPPSSEDFAAALRASVEPASWRLPRPVLPATSSVGRAAGACDPSGDEPATVMAGRHGTRLFGPRPPKPREMVHGPGRHLRWPDRHRRVAAAACVVAVALGGLVWQTRGHGDRRDPHAAVAADSPRAPCAAFPELSAAKGVKRFSADLNGDGCPVPVAWDGQVLSARFEPNERVPRYYEIGARGDVLLFGDWDCDGAASPALYRPTAGSVIYVNAFAQRIGDKAYAERITRQLPRRGSAHVEKGADGCQVVRIGSAHS